jgi:predicted metal-binding membrane protein
MQLVLTRVALLGTDPSSTGGLFAAAIFIGAGLYQFSALKHACLARCQHPFPFFFANWATTTAGVFRLGVRQGLYCLGCCWALMLVMLAVGVMNVVWMAGLAAVMTIEKLQPGRRFAQGVGVALIAVGAGIVVSAAAMHWH